MKTKGFVNKNNKPIIPVRIREARIARELSLSDLANEIGVTKQAISKYELGVININSFVLLKIANVLDFPTNFFSKPKENGEENYSKSVVFFRSVKVPKKITNAVEQKIEFIYEIVSFLSKYINFPCLDIFDIETNIPKGDLDNEKIEEIALRLREHWGIGTKPIKNLSNLLLKKGFIISRIELNTTKMDAHSCWIKGMPYIILSSDKDCAVRDRFSLAHELGHLILHSHLDDDEARKNHKLIENEANRFAGAFLMPVKSFANDIYSASLDNFLLIKEKWKVSIASMIKRCYELDLTTEDQYRNLNKHLAIKKWKKKEPLDDVIEFEKPNIFKEAFDLLLENNILNVDDILNEIALKPDEIEKLCFLPENYFKNYINKTTKPKLKLIKPK
jgi:Zn-dependent peptidase ImmA (M78 family)/DNA-binding XRE family transcriptional regulator